ncbi:uncharacterized protein PRCAT00000954001 [Priceomyces carsonii]|uniref:uncharacterized protein n=1 Tax=Priceomyces carsonii TaxID=28549 RepID=UPI002ED7EB76|nr:unnamed protein product [Priceomyces carsonii]
MTYSTGRGGAGNIQKSSAARSDSNQNELKSPELLPVTSATGVNHNEKDKKVYYSTGRGGAGNIKLSKEKPSPKLVAQGSSTPELHTSKISTGRGGYGNMINNDDPKLSRKLQDVDGPLGHSKENELYAVASNKSFSVGRGGFGNVVTSKSVSPQLTENNLYTLSSHGEKGNKERQKKKGLFEKLRGMFNSE